MTVQTTMPNQDEMNSAVYNYYQYGFGGSHDMLFIELLSMYIEKPAYHTLRTTEQLGYIVWTMDDTRNGIQALTIRVQSGTRSAEFLNKRIQHFIQQLLLDVHALTPEQYCTFIQTLVATKAQKSLTLADEATRLWNHITEQKYDFELHDRQVNILRAELVHKMTSFIHFIEQVFGKTLQIIGDKYQIVDLPDSRTLAILINPLDMSHFSTAAVIPNDDTTTTTKTVKSDVKIEMGTIPAKITKSSSNGVVVSEILEMRELKTLCDEFPLYPMRAISSIPPLFSVPSTDNLLAVSTTNPKA
jgi:hypothetical protein